jgi:hypothetical protein
MYIQPTLNPVKRKPWRTTGDITVDNYHEFKPSAFIHSFVYDIDYAIGKKKAMDMTAFTKKALNNPKACLPCLGGIACMNMGLAKSYSRCSLWDYIASLGDDIRRGNLVGDKTGNNLVGVISIVEKLWGIKLEGVESGALRVREGKESVRTVKYRNKKMIFTYFAGIMGETKLKELREQVVDIANMYRSQGY